MFAVSIWRVCSCSSADECCKMIVRCKALGYTSVEALNPNVIATHIVNPLLCVFKVCERQIESGPIAAVNSRSRTVVKTAKQMQASGLSAADMWTLLSSVFEASQNGSIAIRCSTRELAE